MQYRNTCIFKPTFIYIFEDIRLFFFKGKLFKYHIMYNLKGLQKYIKGSDKSATTADFHSTE